MASNDASRAPWVTRSRSGRLRGVCAGLTTLALAVTMAVAAPLAGPPRPAHADPDGLQSTDGVAAQLGQIGAQMAAADQQLKAASVTVEVATEHYQRAVVDQQRAQQGLAAAQAADRHAGADLDAAQRTVGAMARSNYEYGGAVGAFATFVSSRPADAMRNLGWLRAATSGQKQALQAARNAKAVTVLTAGNAKTALDACDQAKQAAAQQRSAALAAVSAHQQTVAGIQAHKADLQNQLSQIEAHNESVRQAAAAQAAQQAQQQAAQQAAAQQAVTQAQGGGTEGGSDGGDNGGSNGGGNDGGGGGDNGGGGAAPVVNGSGDAMVAVRAALTQIGKPYVWDAADPDVGFDCSGLVLWAYAKIGIDMPHDAVYQYPMGSHPSTDDLRPGDMLFYSNDGTMMGIHHVTMYIGNGQIIEAADFGVPVHVIGVYFGSDFFGVTRLVG